MHSHTVFAEAGRDAIVVVISQCTSRGEYKLKEANLQITALPQPKCALYLADATAIKVRLLYPGLIYTPPPTLGT